VLVLENENWQSGMSTSIKLAVKWAQSIRADALILLTCDQISINRNDISNLIETASKNDCSIVASTYADTYGVPCLFRRNLFAELLKLEGDTGAKRVIAQNLASAVLLPMPHAAIDIDTAEDLAALENDTIS